MTALDEHSLRTAFAVFDHGTGLLSCDDMVKILTRGPQGLHKPTAESLVLKLKKSENGLIKVEACITQLMLGSAGNEKASTPALEYASSCFFPTTWLEVPMIEKTDFNHDTSIYAFGLPGNCSLNLPVCACMLLRADGAFARCASPQRPPVSSAALVTTRPGARCRWER